jgi:O-antigen biosynthesis protein
VTIYYKIENQLLPRYTRRRRVYDMIIKTIKEEGWQSLFSKIIQKLSNKDPLYRQWILKNEPDKDQLRNMQIEQETWSYRPKISIITPAYNPNEYDISQCIRSVLDQIYDNWELCLVDGGSDRRPVGKAIERFVATDRRIKVVLLSNNMGIAGNSNEALKLATGEYVSFLDHDDMLAPLALYEVVKLLNKDRKIDFLYSDEDKLYGHSEKRFEPRFKPDWSPDTLLSYNYACHFAVVRKKLVDEIGGFREGYDGSQDYDLILRIVERTDNIARIPKILYHWRAVKTSTASNLEVKMYAYSAAKKSIQDYLRNKGLDAEVLDGMFLGSYRVKYKIKPFQKISIIIPTKDKVHLLRQCVSSILTKTDYKHFEILIVDNKSVEQKTFDFYNSIKNEGRIKIMRYDEEPFNFPAINNFAARSTDSEYLMFLNNDIEVINSEWLTAILEFAQRKDVGAVGAKLCYKNNTIQHGGVIIGIGGVAGHSHKHFPRSNPGYMKRLDIIQNLSAVTGACMMVRREVFDEVGGFDEKLTIAFNDVDLCLKIREKGYLIVYTPYAELYHYESMSRGYEDTPERKARFTKELAYMKRKWQQLLEKGDPYYNPNLTLDKEDFSIRL